MRRPALVFRVSVPKSVGSGITFRVSGPKSGRFCSTFRYFDPESSLARCLLVVSTWRGTLKSVVPAFRDSPVPDGRVPAASFRQGNKSFVRPAAAFGGRAGGGTETPEPPPSALFQVRNAEWRLDGVRAAIFRSAKSRAPPRSVAFVRELSFKTSPVPCKVEADSPNACGLTFPMSTDRAAFADSSR